MPFTIEYPEDKAQIADFDDFVSLVDEVQRSEPYFDPPGSLSAADWLPKTCDQSSHILLARQGGRLAGYCTAQPFMTYGNFQSSPADYGIDPESCLYLSELGVSATGRGSGIGTALVNDLRDRMARPFTSILVRTMPLVHGTQRPNRAIAFYEKLGFALVRAGAEPLVESGPALRHKPRVFLRWTH